MFSIISKHLKKPWRPICTENDQSHVSFCNTTETHHVFLVGDDEMAEPETSEQIEHAGQWEFLFHCVGGRVVVGLQVHHITLLLIRQVYLLQKKKSVVHLYMYTQRYTKENNLGFNTNTLFSKTCLIRHLCNPLFVFIFPRELSMLFDSVYI